MPTQLPTPIPTFTAFNTNWRVRFLFIVAPPDSQEFAELLNQRVGPYLLLKLISRSDIVRRTIHRLFHRAVSVGDTRLAQLLFKDCPEYWVMGPTYENTELRE